MSFQPRNDRVYLSPSDLASGAGSAQGLLGSTLKLGVDANQPIIVEGPMQGAPAPRVGDPDLIASCGAAWVRLNFIRGPWSGPGDQNRHQGRTWAETYGLLVDQFLEKGLNVYALVGHELMEAAPDFFRVPRGQMSAHEIAQAQGWIEAYAETFLEVVRLFHERVKFFESFNEPDDWHGQQRPWIHPSWFAAMLQAIYRKVKLETGIQDVVLVSGPLQGLEINGNVGPTTYLRQAYMSGKQEFGWGQPGRPYPFDGVGYHLYIKEAFNADWDRHELEVRQMYRQYVDGMLGVIRSAEGDPHSPKQLYISEIGWPSNGNTPEEWEFQAKSLSLALELMNDDPAVALGIWFCTEDFAPGHKFYGLYHMGNVNPEGRKPAFGAYKATADRLRAALAPALTLAAEEVEAVVSVGPPAPAFLGSRADLAGVPLAPPQSSRIEAGLIRTPVERRVTRAWNRYGGLLLALADALQIRPGAAAAVVANDVTRSGFARDGRMTIRFDPSIFFDRWGAGNPDVFAQHFSFDPDRSWQRHRWRPAADATWRACHRGQAGEWEAFELARGLDDTAAKLSLAMGAPQIMGFNHAAIGYPSVGGMFDAFSRDECYQMLGFFDLIAGPGATSRTLSALRSLDLATFAGLYYGPDQVARQAGRLQSAFAAFQRLRPEV